jgi:CheY-like chemotaxis protein
LDQSESWIQNPGQATPKILVVEDDRISQQFIQLALEQKHFDLRFASNGLEAISITDQFAPDLVVTDFLMPEMDGGRLVNQLRKSGISCPVLMITAVEMDVNSWLQAPDGVTVQLHKPVSAGELRKSIDHLLGLPKVD